jgi:hypothetical protein
MMVNRPRNLRKVHAMRPRRNSDMNRILEGNADGGALVKRHTICCYRKALQNVTRLAVTIDRLVDMYWIPSHTTGELVPISKGCNKSLVALLGLNQLPQRYFISLVKMVVARENSAFFHIAFSSSKQAKKNGAAAKGRLVVYPRGN